MEQLYIATVFAGALVCLLASLLLWLRRKTGERSRVILSVIVLFSVCNYTIRFIELSRSMLPDMIVSPGMLLLANFMVVSYILYPIEVIVPGWLHWKRVCKLYAPLMILYLFYLISSYAGIHYRSYPSLLEMWRAPFGFDTVFSVLLTVFIVAPIFFIRYVYHKRKYNNTDLQWLKRYTTALSINIIAYLMVLLFNHLLLHTVYYYISVGCSLFIVYMELYDRIIGKPTVTHSTSIVGHKDEALIGRLDAFMQNNYAWRDPNLSLTTLASALLPIERLWLQLCINTGLTRTVRI